MTTGCDEGLGVPRRAAERRGQKAKSSDGGMGFLRELPVLVLVALAIALVVKSFVVQAFYIPSASMEDTLLINDRVLVSKFVYRFKDPWPGDIVVFVAPASAPDRPAASRGPPGAPQLPEGEPGP